MSTHRATFYLQLEAKRNRRWNFNAQEYVEGVDSIRATAITQNRPEKPRPGAVITKLTIEVPDGAFLPLQLEAIVIIPEGLVDTGPIEVEAVDAHEPALEEAL